MDQTTLEYNFDIKTSQIDMIQDRGYIVHKFEEGIIDNIDNFSVYINNLESENYQNDSFWSNKGLDFSILENITPKIMKDIYSKNNWGHPLAWQVYWNANNTKILLVYYINSNSSISVDFIRYLINFINPISKIRRNGHGIEMFNILISNNDMSSASSNMFENIPDTQFFLETDMTFNPIDHILNQEHILLTPSQVVDLLSELKIDKSKLPNIKYDNAIVKYNGWKVGDVIKVKRTEYYVSILAKQSLNYRVVTV